MYLLNIKHTQHKLKQVLKGMDVDAMEIRKKQKVVESVVRFVLPGNFVFFQLLLM